MNFQIGQAVCGKIRFKDGAMPEYDRTYLVVNVGQDKGIDYIEVLNVSSIKGKERKLLYSTNEKINHHWPPFKKPSFVKLDSLTRVSGGDLTSLHVLCRGSILNSADLHNIVSKIIR